MALFLRRRVDKGEREGVFIFFFFFTTERFRLLVVVDARAKMVKHRTLKHTLANGYVTERHQLVESKLKGESGTQ